jgi:hypothetical protein
MMPKKIRPSLAPFTPVDTPDFKYQEILKLNPPAGRQFLHRP